MEVSKIKMTWLVMEFKGKHNRKYKIRMFADGPYQFYEGGKWVYEMKGEIALQEMIKDVGRKGGHLVYAANENGTITSNNI